MVSERELLDRYALFGGGAAKRCPTPDGTEDGQ